MAIKKKRISNRLTKATLGAGGHGLATLPLAPQAKVQYVRLDVCVNDPSAGSPTETLLRLLLPLSDKVHQTSCCSIQELVAAAVRIIHRITQSVGATGGVYKGQGRNQHELMIRTY